MPPGKVSPPARDAEDSRQADFTVRTDITQVTCSKDFQNTKSIECNLYLMVV